MFFPTADTTAKPSAFPVKAAVAARIPEAVDVPSAAAIELAVALR
jgi:hypothetical protein